MTYENRYFFRLKNSLHICKVVIFSLIGLLDGVYLCLKANKSVPFVALFAAFYRLIGENLTVRTYLEKFYIELFYLSFLPKREKCT